MHKEVAKQKYCKMFCSNDFVSQDGKGLLRGLLSVLNHSTQKQYRHLNQSVFDAAKSYHYVKLQDRQYFLFRFV